MTTHEVQLPSAPDTTSLQMPAHSLSHAGSGHNLHHQRNDPPRRPLSVNLPYHLYC